MNQLPHGIQVTLDTLNELLASLESEVGQARQRVEDAKHELMKLELLWESTARARTYLCDWIARHYGQKGGES